MNLASAIVLACIPAAAGIIVGVVQVRDALETHRKEEADKRRKFQEANASLRSIIGSVDNTLGFMAGELGVAHPCEDVWYDHWFDVHTMMRSQLINAWIAKKERTLDRIEPEEREEWMVRWLGFWESALNNAVHGVPREHEVVKPYISDIAFVENRLNRRWGILDLKDSERMDSRRLVGAVRQSLEEIVTRLESMDMMMRKDDYLKARQACDSVMMRKHPGANGIDLIPRQITAEEEGP